MEGSDFVDIVVEDTAIFYIEAVDIEEVDIDIALSQLAYSHHSSSSRCQSSSLATTGTLCNLFHHVLQIYKIYKID